MRNFFAIFAIFLLVFAFSACGCDDEEIVYVPDIIYTPEPNGQSEELDPPVDIPEHDEHQVFLVIDPTERTVSGSSHINFTNRTGDALETIVLRVYLNAFSEGAEVSPVFEENEWLAFPNGQDFGSFTIEDAYADYEPLTFELDETVLTLILDEPLEPYETVRLFLLYNATIPEIAHRVGANEYAMWFGMFLPTLAVYQDGWRTDAHYPAGNPFFTNVMNYRVDITTPSRYTVVGTGVRTEEVITDTDTKSTRFTAYRARDFAFALSPYFSAEHTTTESGVDIHLYYFTEGLDADEILDAARRSMEYFEARIGAFPLGHVTIVEAQLIQDSVSFSQVVFVDSWELARGGRYWGLAHGLGNQWLASIVGTNRVAEPWLTNGLTRFVQAGLFYPDAESLRARMERDYLTIYERTTLVLANGLGASPNREHYAHTHGRKAMLMTYALYNYVGGDDVFWEIIAEYYRRFAFEIAAAEDFINIAEEISGRNLRDFLDPWLSEGTVPGLP
ncbi:MAG: M1 family metallopeptidase [Defluviitaleaceae bacterium]|nr:M1 family metallopeptidase [Defluviitaleaceae bacterium]